MGGGIRGSRRYPGRPVGTGSLRPYLKDKKSDGVQPSKKRTFISFHVADEAQVELLRQQAKDERYDIEFVDYSVKEPFDEKWKTQCTERIKQSSVVICFIGEDTHKREAVLWEMRKAYELGKRVIGVRIYRDKNHKIPTPLKEHGAKIVNWDLDAISDEINKA